jgi:hypothetical protein
MAEREGFEPSIPCGMRAFQARALDHYAISPEVALLYQRLIFMPILGIMRHNVRAKNKVEERS